MPLKLLFPVYSHKGLHEVASVLLKAFNIYTKISKGDNLAEEHIIKLLCFFIQLQVLHVLSKYNTDLKMHQFSIQKCSSTWPRT